MPRCRFSKDTALMDLTPVENLFLKEYMPCASAEQTKVYLYGLMLCHTREEGDIARALNLTEQQVYEAFCYWQQQGLLRILGGEPLCVEYLEVKKCVSTVACGTLYRHKHLFEGLQQAFPGRSLTPQELHTACDWVEVFGLSEEAAVYLAQYCAGKKGADIGFKYMDAVARGWADAGVSSLSDAQLHLGEYEEKTGGAAKIKKLWRQAGNPTGPELELYEKWTRGWGFTPEAVQLLAHETTGSDKPNFRYLDAIIAGYREQGLRTAPDIAATLQERESRTADLKERTRLIFERAGIRRTPNAADREQVETWIYNWKMPMELLFFAAERAASANRPFLYLRKLVADYRQKGITTLAAAEAEAKRHEETKPRDTAKTKDSAWNYPQHHYTDEELSGIAVPLDGEDTHG